MDALLIAKEALIDQNIERIVNIVSLFFSGLETNKRRIILEVYLSKFLEIVRIGALDAVFDADLFY